MSPRDDGRRSLDGLVAEQPRAQHDVAGGNARDDESAVGVGDRAARRADDRHARSLARLGRRCVDHPAGDDAGAPDAPAAARAAAGVNAINATSAAVA